ncbi:SlyX family protein [Glaciecola sp.]|nr:SlyX family protein [Glaciecola sp.]
MEFTDTVNVLSYRVNGKLPLSILLGLSTMTKDMTTVPSVLTAQLINELDSRIVDLESKVAFQDDTIESLNDALSQQQQQLAQMTYKMNHMVERLKSMQPSNIATQDEEAPPPHY